MPEHPVADDSSHYEISLTAGQAFIAFVLLLCSLGAAFAFGVLVGRGQLDERLVVRREPAVVTEGTPPENGSRIVELGVEPPREFTGTAPAAASTAAPPPVVIEELPSAGTAPAPVIDPAPSPAPAISGPVIAQVLASSEQGRAETLAAELIEAGFTGAYVERAETDRGMIYRVRIRFPSEPAARSAEPRLRAMAGGGEVLITRP